MRSCAKQAKTCCSITAGGRRASALRMGVPRLGEHTREILVEHGFDDGEIAEFFKSRTIGAG